MTKNVNSADLDAEVDALLGPEPESPLDRKLAVTIFNNRHATEKRKEATWSLRKLAKAATTVKAPSKDDARHIKLGRFGERLSKNAA